MVSGGLKPIVRIRMDGHPCLVSLQGFIVRFARFGVRPFTSRTTVHGLSSTMNHPPFRISRRWRRSWTLPRLDHALQTMLFIIISDLACYH